MSGAIPVVAPGPAVAAPARRERDVAGVPLSVLLWGVGYVLLGAVLAALAAWPLYQAPRVVLIAAVGTALGVGIALLARLLRWGVTLTALVAVAVYLLAVVPLAVPSGLRSLPAVVAGLRDGLFGVVLGWKQLLTLNPPLGEYQAVLVPFFVVVFVGSLVGALLAVHPGRRATAAVAAVSVMPLFGLVFGLNETSPTASVLGVSIAAPREVAIGVGAFVAAIAWLIGRSRLLRRRALRMATAQSISRRAAPMSYTVRRHALSALLVAVALVAGVAIVPAAAGWSERTVLRDGIDPQIVVREQSSPLASYRSWFTSDRLDETLLQVEGDTGDVDRLRLVTLDEYDGREFHVSASEQFRRLPQSAPETPDQARFGVTIGDGYQGIWLPVPSGLLAAPDFGGSRGDALADGFHVDESASTAITVAQAPGGGHGVVPGDAYRVIAEAPEAASDLPSIRGGEPLISAEEYPALAEWAAAQEQPRSGAGFLELVERLRARGYLSHALLEDEAAAGWVEALQQTSAYEFASSYAGHSRARIEQLFTSLNDQQRRMGVGATDEMLVAAVGDDEQFATAVALLARYWGLESRVVLGVRLSGADAVAGIPACDDTCTGASMAAWVEVRSGGGAWSAVDVTPQHELLPSTITEGEQMPEHPTVPEDVRSEVVDPPRVQSDSTSDADAQAPDPLSTLASMLPVLRIVGMSAGALLLLLLPFAVLLIAKALRRRGRQNAPDAEARVVGAWEELLDTYVDHRVPFTAHGTRPQISDSVGRPAVARLAVLADDAVFAPHDPDPARADEAWEIIAAERAQLRADAPWRDRVRASLSLRSLLLRAFPARRRDAAASSVLGTLGLGVSFSQRPKEET